jgi:hypothetical protein
VQLSLINFINYNNIPLVGDNTFPNFLPITTGYNEQQLKGICYPSTNTKLDDCPFIWKQFERANYLTGLIEDSPIYAIFNYQKTGFVRQPVDFYSRPLWLAAHEVSKKNHSFVVVG